MAVISGHVLLKFPNELSSAFTYIIIIIINVKHSQNGFLVFNTEVIRSNYLNYILKTI